MISETIRPQYSVKNTSYNYLRKSYRNMLSRKHNHDNEIFTLKDNLDKQYQKQNSLYFGFVYLLKKIYRLIGSKQIIEVPPKINNYQNTAAQMIQKIALGVSPLNTCVGCAPYFIQNFPITSRYELVNTQPYFIVNQSNIYAVDELRALICSLANYGIGHILVVQKHIKNLIKQKINNLNKISIQRINNILQQALKGIVGREHIFFYIDTVPLKNQKNELDFNQKDVIRIRVNVSQRRQQEGFYTQYKFKNYKPIYKIYDIKSKIFASLVQYQPIQIQNNYTDMHLLPKKCINKNIKCKCHKIIYQGIWFNINFQSDIQYAKQDINFTNDSQQYVVDVFNQCMNQQKNKKSNFEEEFPEIKQNESVVIFTMQEKCNIEQLSNCVKRIFNMAKTNYKHIIPIQAFQKEIIKYHKKKNSIVCKIMYFIFEGKYEIFRDEFYKALNQAKVKKEEFVMDQLQSKIQLGYIMTEEEISKFDELLFEIFTDIPRWQKVEYFNQKSKKAYKSPKLELIAKNQAMFTFLLTHMAKLRPKFSLLQNKNTTSFNNNNNNYFNYADKGVEKYKKKSLLYKVKL